MSSELFRKYIDMINEAGEVPNASSQQDLAQLYAKAKPMSFIKNTPVALVPYQVIVLSLVPVASNVEELMF